MKGYHHLHSVGDMVTTDYRSKRDGDVCTMLICRLYKTFPPITISFCLCPINNSNLF